VFNEFIGVI